MRCLRSRRAAGRSQTARRSWQWILPTGASKERKLLKSIHTARSALADRTVANLGTHYSPSQTRWHIRAVIRSDLAHRRGDLVAGEEVARNILAASALSVIDVKRREGNDRLGRAGRRF